MRTQIAALLLSPILLAGCGTPAKVEPSRMVGGIGDDMIRQKIIGTWQSDSPSFSKTVTFTFDADGSFALTNAGALDSSKHAWRASRGWVIITPTKEVLPTNTDLIINILSLNDHELVCQPGISIAGDPWRFTRL